ncbi:LLM class flavin-dependent oxidoreductase [Promicromonospora vindobonensis]|uniref:LLM class flavin-dependent oxidoreductase n=1 Tax=Promicromonospora vindobonensis TaxID=195748 RepID=A0ABW5W042_9MICO
MELGIAVFGDASAHPETGQRVSEAQAIRNIQEAAVLTEEVGLDWFGVGEHHTPEFPASAAGPILGAVAARTSRIKLSSAVTVLGTDDPVRIYQQFSTIDALSNGRAEIIAGRGSSTESFPLFGYSLEDYDQLFAEKLDLLLEVNRSPRVTWKGATRPPLNGEYVPPRAEHGRLPVWLGVGGTPSSAVRAAQRGLPMAIGLLAGDPIRSAAIADLYRAAAAQLGNTAEQTRVMIGTPGFVADDGNAARDTWWPHYRQFMKTVGEQRGFVPPGRPAYDDGTASDGALLVGSPEEIAERIVRLQRRWGHVRQFIHMDWGGLPQAEHLRAIELFGTKVKPMVDAEIGETAGTGAITTSPAGRRGYPS